MTAASGRVGLVAVAGAGALWAQVFSAAADVPRSVELFVEGLTPGETAIRLTGRGMVDQWIVVRVHPSGVGFFYNCCGGDEPIRLPANFSTNLQLAVSVRDQVSGLLQYPYYFYPGAGLTAWSGRHCEHRQQQPGRCYLALDGNHSLGQFRG